MFMSFSVELVQIMKLDFSKEKYIQICLVASQIKELWNDVGKYVRMLG